MWFLTEHWYTHTHTHTHTNICTRSENKVMRLIPKKFILFIHQLQCCHLQSTSIVPAHTFSSGAAIACSIPEMKLVGCHLRPVLQPCGCLLLVQSAVLSLPILLWNKKKSQGAIQVNKEAVATPCCIWMSKTALNRMSCCCCVRFVGTILAQIFLIPNSSVSMRWFPSSWSLHQQSIWLLIFEQIEQVLFLVLCCHLSVLLMVVCWAARLQQWFCIQKIFCTSKRLVLLTLHRLHKPAEVFSVFLVALSQTLKQKNGIHTVAWCSMLPFPKQGSQTSWHIKHLLHTETLQDHVTVSGDGGRIKVKGCLC